MPYCSKCGHANESSNKLCSKCGTPIMVGNPIPDMSVPEISPSDAPLHSHNVVQPISVKGSHSKIVVGVVIAEVFLLLCALIGALIGYWSFQMKKSDKIVEYAAPKEVVVTAAVPAVTDKNLVQVNSNQKETKAIPKEDVQNLVTKWLNSWKSGDMETYRICYVSGFQSKRMNLDAWVSHKTNVQKKSKDINISIDDLQISEEENSATAVFTQTYSSSILKDKGKKTLELRKIDNQWKIYKEIM